MEYRIFGTSGHITFDVNGGMATLFSADGSIERLPDLALELRYPEWAPAQKPRSCRRIACCQRLAG